MSFLDSVTYFAFYGSFVITPFLVFDIWTAQQDVLQELKMLACMIREKEVDGSEDSDESM